MVENAPENKTQMVSAQVAKAHMVKIEALLPISLKRGDDFISVRPGQVVEVSEEEAREFADKVFKGNYGHSGEMLEERAEQSRNVQKRARRV